MKKILLCLFAIFCFSYAYADTVNINWGADNQLYTTTTCDIGTDVILPTPPTKRGHTFRGWKKDSFNRGTWPDWDTVPTDADYYPTDYYNNHTPKTNDYMIVEDVSSYPVNAIIIEKSPSTTSAYNIPIKCTVNGTETSILYSRDSEAYICDGKIKISCYQSNYFDFYANTDLYYNGKLLHLGDFIAEAHWMNHLKIGVSLTQINGTWRFLYDGNWDIDNKFGWKNIEQIVNE